MPFQLLEEEKQLLLTLARQTLATLPTDNLEKILIDFKHANHLTPSLLELRPCFVTLTGKKGKLRGCIGCTDTTRPLYQNVFEYTQYAASHDFRFQPVEAPELPHINIHIAVLGPLTPLPSLNVIEIGRHGLFVTHGSNRGLLLASVAKEYGWNKQQFLEQTCVKAGLEPSLSDKYDKFYFEEFSFSEGK
ncbi:MAG: AmmeMemoRadiSam system protein A [Deltaproteobacteria bacterium]|nr:AmmeMemoRadiSam system protein A [Deltaproteobacteria bacterium]